MTAGRMPPLWRSLVCLRAAVGVLVACIAVSVSAAGAADALTPVRITAYRLTGDGEHATVVEPHSAAFGSTIVAVFQVRPILDDAGDRGRRCERGQRVDCV